MANITEITIDKTVKESRQIMNDNFTNLNEGLLTAGSVKTVNNTQPDANGNITVDLGSYATAIAKMQTCILGTPTLTLLAGGTSTSNWIGTGNITLSQSWRNFDALLLYVTGNLETDGASPIMLFKWQFEAGLNYHKTRGSGFLLPVGGLSAWWEINASSTTDTVLVLGRENSGVAAIYGVKFTATGITNASAVDVTAIQSKVSSILTTDNHLILPSGLEVW